MWIATSVPTPRKSARQCGRLKPTCRTSLHILNISADISYAPPWACGLHGHHPQNQIDHVISRLLEGLHLAIVCQEIRITTDGPQPPKQLRSNSAPKHQKSPKQTRNLQPLIMIRFQTPNWAFRTHEPNCTNRLWRTPHNPTLPHTHTNSPTRGSHKHVYGLRRKAHKTTLPHTQSITIRTMTRSGMWLEAKGSQAPTHPLTYTQTGSHTHTYSTRRMAHRPTLPHTQTISHRMITETCRWPHANPHTQRCSGQGSDVS